MQRRMILPGPVLVGFAAMFDRAYGDPKTPRPYARVAPTKMGSVLLPFPCPNCSAVRAEVVDPKTRKGYTDEERGFSWCPSCYKRYVIEPEGIPLAEAIPEGAEGAPARITWADDRVEILGVRAPDGLLMLGAG